MLPKPSHNIAQDVRWNTKEVHCALKRGDLSLDIIALSSTRSAEACRQPSPRVYASKVQFAVSSSAYAHEVVVIEDRSVDDDDGSMTSFLDQDLVGAQPTSGSLPKNDKGTSSPRATDDVWITSAIPGIRHAQPTAEVSPMDMVNLGEKLDSIDCDRERR